MTSATPPQPTTTQPAATQPAATQPVTSPKIESAVTQSVTAQQAVSPEIESAITQPAATQPVTSPETELTIDSLTLPDTPAHTSPCDRGQTVSDVGTLEVPSLHVSPNLDPLIALGELPLGAEESAWMKSKRTLKFFREAHRLGKLSDLIVHWHQLEEALSFPEVVSLLIT